MSSIGKRDMELEIQRLEGSSSTPEEKRKLEQLKKLYNSLYPQTNSRKFCKWETIPPPKTDK